MQLLGNNQNKLSPQENVIFEVHTTTPMLSEFEVTLSSVLHILRHCTPPDGSGGGARLQVRKVY